MTNITIENNIKNGFHNCIIEKEFKSKKKYNINFFLLNINLNKIMF